MTKKPVFVINFKAYDNITGDNCVKIAKELSEAARIRSIPLILCVPVTEIKAVASAVSVPIYAQHCDSFNAGARTGWITADMLVKAGAKGTLLNHSEHRVNEHLEENVSAAQRAGLKVILCAQDATEARILRNYSPQWVAVEPPELIGGEVSVSSARPELIIASAKGCPDNLLVGAGVKTRKDVETAMELGAQGVLIASGIVRSPNPKQALLDLCSGW